MWFKKVDEIVLKNKNFSNNCGIHFIDINDRLLMGRNKNRITKRVKVSQVVCFSWNYLHLK